MSESTGVRVLVADDDPDIRELVVFKLTGAGFTVESVGDGVAAWETFQRDVPRLAVLDIQMPGLSGVDVLRRIRASGSPAIPVVLLSGRSSDSDIEVGLAAGATDYLVKPFSPRELLRRVQEILSSSPIGPLGS